MDPEVISSPSEVTLDSDENNPVTETIEELFSWTQQELTTIADQIAELWNQPQLTQEAANELANQITQARSKIQALQTEVIQRLAKMPDPNTPLMESQSPTLPESEVTPEVPMETPPDTPLPTDSTETEVPPRNEEGNPVNETEALPPAQPEKPRKGITFL